MWHQLSSNGYGHSQSHSTHQNPDPTMVCSFSCLQYFLTITCLKLSLVGHLHLWYTSAISGRSMIKFESGYAIETVFDGTKLGIDPYSVEVSPTGELIILDSVNSNVHKVSSPLSRCKSVHSVPCPRVKVYTFSNHSKEVCQENLTCFFIKRWLRRRENTNKSTRERDWHLL